MLFAILLYLAFLILIFGGAIGLIVKVVSAINAASEREKARRELEIKKERDRLVLEKERRDNIKKRDQLLSENREDEYQPIMPISIDENTIYEEKLIIDAFNNNYIGIKNESLRVLQHNLYVNSLKSKLENINEKLNYNKDAGVEQLPASLPLVDIDDSFLSGNFYVMYTHFADFKEWKEFTDGAKKLKNSKRRTLFCAKKDTLFVDFFNGYDVSAIESGHNYFYLFPCYIVKINISENTLKVIKYQESSEVLSAIKAECSQKTFNEFSKLYNNYLAFFKLETNVLFFKCNFSLSETEKSEVAECERKKFINELAEKLTFEDAKTTNIFDSENSKIAQDTHLTNATAARSADSSKNRGNKEELRIRNALSDFLDLKDRINKIKNYNHKVEESKQELRIINEKFNYPENSDIDKLPELKPVPKKKNIDGFYGGFNKLYSFFGEQKEWANFIGKLDNCKSGPDSKILSYDIISLFTDFFSKKDTPFIYMDENTVLALLPCYAVCVQDKPSQDKSVSVIPYDKLKLSVKYNDKKSRTRNNTGGKVIGKEYEHQKKDGSPDNRYRYNPIIYTVRFFSLSVGWGNYNRKIPCIDAESVVRLFEKYAESLSVGLNAFILKNVFTEENDIDIDLLAEKYKNAEKAKKERAKKQRELEERRRLKEENARKEEERRRNLAIIQRQKERNEEMLRQKETEAKALKLFGMGAEDENEGEKPEEKISYSIKSLDSPIVVLSKPLITNNVFKIELEQVSEVNCDEYDIIFIDANKNNISHKRTLKKSDVGEKSTVGIMLLPNIDFTSMKECFMAVVANGVTVAEIPFKMNISFYSDF